MQTIPQLLESGACIVRGWLLALSKKVGASRLEALARKKRWKGDRVGILKGGGARNRTMLRPQHRLSTFP